MICKFYISAFLKGELFISRDTMTVCYLKLFRSVAFDNFIVQRQTLGFFLEKPLLSDRKFANSIYSHVNEIELHASFFFIIYVSIKTAKIFRGGIFSWVGMKAYRGFVKRYIEGGKSACSRCIFVLCMKT